jgi:hypothetical protein
MPEIGRPSATPSPTEVDFDYTSVAGGQPARLKAEDIVTGWTQGLGRYKQTKHHSAFRQ